MSTVLRPAEVARALKVSRFTVYELIRRGDLPATRVGHQFRIEASALAAYRAANRAGAEGQTAHGQEALLVRRGDQVVSLSIPDDLASLPGAELSAAFSRRGTVSRGRYRGAFLHALLAAHGFLPASTELPQAPPLSPEHRAMLRSYIVARGRDGHVVAFSVAEVLPEYAATSVLLAWERDGEPLQSSGPVQLVVPSDMLPTRGVRQLETIEIHEAS